MGAAASTMAPARRRTATLLRIPADCLSCIASWLAPVDVLAFEATNTAARRRLLDEADAWSFAGQSRLQLPPDPRLALDGRTTRRLADALQEIESMSPRSAAGLREEAEALRVAQALTEDRTAPTSARDKTIRSWRLQHASISTVRRMMLPLRMPASAVPVRAALHQPGGRSYPWPAVIALDEGTVIRVATELDSLTVRDMKLMLDAVGVIASFAPGASADAIGALAALGVVPLLLSILSCESAMMKADAAAVLSNLLFHRRADVEEPLRRLDGERMLGSLLSSPNVGAILAPTTNDNHKAHLNTRGQGIATKPAARALANLYSSPYVAQVPYRSDEYRDRVRAVAGVRAAFGYDDDDDDIGNAATSGLSFEHRLGASAVFSTLRSYTLWELHYFGTDAVHGAGTRPVAATIATITLGSDGGLSGRGCDEGGEGEFTLSGRADLDVEGEPQWHAFKTYTSGGAPFLRSLGLGHICHILYPVPSGFFGTWEGVTTRHHSACEGGGVLRWVPIT